MKTDLRLMITLLIAFTCASCSRTEAPSGEPNAVDNTLSSAEYMTRGFPAPDRTWITQDYAAALRVMQTLAIDQLPRSTSNKSAPIIARLTDPTNLGMFTNRSLPLLARLPSCLELVDSANAISKIYLSAQTKNTLFGEDTILIMGFLLQATAVELGMVEEFLPTLNKSDPSYPTRLAGLERMKLGMTQIVQGALMTLEERQAYSSKSRAHFANIVYATFPAIAPQLPPLSRKEFESTLQRIAKEETDSSIKTPLLRIGNRQ